MAKNRLKTIARVRNLLLGVVPKWMAKGYWIILVYISCMLIAYSVSTGVAGETPDTTPHRPVVHVNTIQDAGITYYPASFEANDYKPLQGETPMSFNKDQLREKISAVLRWLEPEIPYSDTAVELLMLTCAQETHLGKYLKQVRGPARGIFQVEPATEIDMWRTLTHRHSDIKAKIDQLTMPMEPAGASNMELNIAYQIAMARYYYYRIPKPLPAHDVWDMAAYWKKYYNTYLGAGTKEEAFGNYKRYCV